MTKLVVAIVFTIGAIIIIALGVSVVSTMGGPNISAPIFATMSSPIPTSTPTATLQTFCSALRASPPDYQTAYNQYSSRQRAQKSEQAFASSLQQALSNPVLGGLKDCTVSNVQESGSTANGVVTLSFNSVNQTVVFNFTLVDTGNIWKIDSGTFTTASISLPTFSHRSL